MRKPRHVTVSRTGIFHKIWRGHNREHVLGSHVDKNDYLDQLGATYEKDIPRDVQWHSYCVMGNHSHETGRLRWDAWDGLKPALKSFGDWMRNAHSRFGMHYNERNGRQGKVAYDRPKTTEVSPGKGMLRAMFYGDANPVRAGLVAHPSRYRYGSYRYFAYGEENAHTGHLTMPEEYLALGKTPRERQRRYRQLCDLYLRQEGLLDDRPDETSEDAKRAADDERTTGVGARARGDPPGG